MSTEISLRFVLTLAEAVAGMKMATRERRGLSHWLMPLSCLGIVLWGIRLGLKGQGWYFALLGVGFLAVQQVLHVVILPWMLKRQYDAQRIGKTEQGIDIYPQQIVLVYGGQRQRFARAEVKAFVKGELCYLLRMTSGMVTIIPRRVVDDEHVTAAFEQALQVK